MHVSARFADWLEARAPKGILDRGFAIRNKLLSSRKFQRFAAQSPFTRAIARRRARAVFDLCAGFVYSQVLQACVQLRVFELLKDGPLEVETLAALMQLSPEAAKKLLAAAASLKLLQSRGPNRYGLGQHGAAILADPGISAMVRHHAMFYEDLSDPVALLRGERTGLALQKYWAYATSEQPSDLTDPRVASYTALMSASQTFVAEDILDAYPVASHRCLLDIGGGDGTFLRAVAARAPALNLKLFDLPAVADMARVRFATAGLAHRAATYGGDFFNDALPEGADLISLVRIIHDHDDEPVRKLFRAIHKALPGDGRLLIAEPLAGTAGAEPVGDAYFAFYLMAMGSGRPRTADEITAMLKAEGFSRVRFIATAMPLQASLLIAER